MESCASKETLGVRGSLRWLTDYPGDGMRHKLKPENPSVELATGTLSRIELSSHLVFNSQS